MWASNVPQIPMLASPIQRGRRRAPRQEASGHGQPITFLVSMPPVTPSILAHQLPRFLFAWLGSSRDSEEAL